jgi:aquaporin NIP
VTGDVGLGRRPVAEGIAAFALVFAGCGAIIADERYDDAVGAVGVSLVFGLIIMVMIYATGHLSGAHINPAVTIAFTLTRHFAVRDAVAYITAQLAGALLGALALLAVWTDKPAGLGATVPSVDAGSAFVYEVILTAFLMFVIISFGPALATGEWTDFWVYVAGPVIGAAVGAFAYQVIRGEPSQPGVPDAPALQDERGVELRESAGL